MAVKVMTARKRPKTKTSAVSPVRSSPCQGEDQSSANGVAQPTRSSAP